MHLKELHQAIRRIVRSPGFCIIAVLLIAIGVGTATTIFAFLDALLLRPLPIRDPANLVQVVQLFPNLRAQGYFPLEMYRRLADGSSTLFDVAGQSEMAVILDNGAGPERAYVQAVTDNFFAALGIEPVVGTVFGSDDAAVAVLSYDGWTRYFGRDPNAIGHFVRLGGHAFQIIGVTRQGFNGTNPDTSPAMRVPYRFITQLEGPEEGFLEIIARLRPGVPREEAQREATNLWKSLPEALPGARTNSRVELRSIEYGASYFREQFRTALIALMAGIALVLLVVCSNVGGLLLARSAARAKETAVRLALGAARMRIVVECIIDSLLLMLLGGAAGAVLTYGGVALLMRRMPPMPLNSFDLRPFSLNVGVGLRAIIFAIAACGLMTILSAFAPAWRATRDDPYAILKGTMSEVRHRRLQTFLCSFQIALCLVLVISTGLMARTLSNLNTLDPGFEKGHVATFSIDPRLGKYDSQQVWSLQQRLLQETQSISGVEAVAISVMPLMRGIGTITGITLPGQGQQLTNVNFVTTGYFDLMKMRVVAGRPFQSTDKPDAKPQPVIVNEEFVRRFLQGRKAVAVRLGRAGDREIVGVVNDSYYRSLRENPPPILYVSDFGPNAYPRPFVLYIRTRYPPEPMVEPIRRVLQSVDPKIPIYEASTIAVDIERSLWRERLVGKLATWFGTFTLLLSAIGLYGTLAYYVTQRRREFGLRRALGASVRHVIETVLRRISAVMISGLAGGFGVYFITARWLKTLFFGVRLADPISITTAVLLLMATAAAAAGIPIYRALHLDPASVLRHD